MEGEYSINPDMQVDSDPFSLNDELSLIKEHYESGIQLSDAELDCIADIAVTTLKELLSFFEESNLTIDEYDGDEGELILDVNGDDLAILIGRHGRTLDALQLIFSSLISTKLHFHFPFVVDIEGYKSRRKMKIQSIARAAATRAKQQKGEVVLNPMTAYERRLAHLAVCDDEHIMTHSIGEDPERRVVITYIR